MSTYNDLAIIIPTRNRAEFAINAINSVLNQIENDVYIIVSDNSTDEKELEKLKNFCEINAHPNLVYFRSSKSLSMTDHWNWIMMEILNNENLKNITHFMWIADRNVLVKNAVSSLKDLIKKHPDDYIRCETYCIYDFSTPVKIWNPKDFTEKVISIKCEDNLFDIYNNVKLPEYGVPINLYSVTPRSVFKNLIKKYGNVFDSTGPDTCFAFRVLAHYDGYLFYDKPISIIYEHKISNCQASTSGIKNKTINDFKSFFNKNQSIVPDAPLPQIEIAANSLINDYCFVAKETKSEKFKEINMNNYLHYLFEHIKSIQNEELKEYYLNILKEKGYKPKPKDKGFKKFINKEIPRIQRKIKKLFAQLSGRAKYYKEISFADSMQAIKYINDNLI